ncbi:MAG: extracellular solute-binding protein, partial [Muribaculaceae bacterium]|nr:extracellular solute-binding protein [Muribaculaceae bacterium]
VYYNTETLEENGLDDPWDLYKAGEWNWDTFKGMLADFVDEDNDQYGLDNWYNEMALTYSTGVPMISFVDGHLQCNFKDPTIERAMNFQYELYNAGLVANLEQYDWVIQPQMMGEKRQVLWIGGSWEAEGDPEAWAMKIPPENLGIAPTPNPADAEHPYQAAALEGYVLCKGSANPEGAARFAECTILANVDDAAHEIFRQKRMEDAHWSEELVDRLDEINGLAQQYPIVDLASGCTTQIADAITGSATSLMKAAFHGSDWASTRESYSDNIELAVSEVDAELQTKLEEFN